MNINSIAPLAGIGLSIGTMIYQTGKHADRLDCLNKTVNALGKQEVDDKKTLYLINSKMMVMDERLKHMEADIADIKNIIKK